MKMSLEIDRATKRIVGCAIVLNPRVTDAQVVAFSNGTDPEPRKGASMSFIDKIKAAFGQAIDEAAKDLEFTPANFAAETEMARLRTENAQLKAAQGAASTSRVNQLAAEFADGLVSGNVALPAERDPVRPGGNG